MGVIVISGKTRWGSKEVGESKEVGSERGEEGSRRRWGGGGNSGNGGFDDQQGNILDGDVFVVNNFTRELELCPIFLIEWRKEAVEFGLGKTDYMGGCMFTKLFKVEFGHGVKGFKGGLWGRRGWGLDNVGAGVNGAGLEGVQVNKGNVRIGRQGGEDRESSRSKERETRDNKLRAGHNGGQPGYGRGLGAARILEAGASRNGVIPHVVGTVEDVVDNLKGSSGIGLIDFIQVRPGGNREGRCWGLTTFNGSESLRWLGVGGDRSKG